MAKLAELRAQAKKLGIAPTVVRGASTAKELREIIEEFQSDGSSKKKSGKKASKKSTTATTGKRGRPKGSKNSTKSTSKATPAAKKSGNSGKAKRSSTAGEGNGGRFLLGKIDYNNTDGWNPRDGSAPDRIVKSLRKFKGDRTKVFAALKGDVWDFCSKRLKDGTKRKLDDGSRYSAYNMLKYRIARTDWDFAMKTEQHESSDDRVEYGTGGTGEGIFGKATKKSTKNSTSAKSSTTKKSTKSTTTGKKRGRPAGSKNKTTAKASTKATGKAKRGRPKGSKNKK